MQQGESQQCLRRRGWPQGQGPLSPPTPLYLSRTPSTLLRMAPLVSTALLCLSRFQFFWGSITTCVSPSAPAEVSQLCVLRAGCMILQHHCCMATGFVLAVTANSCTYIDAQSYACCSRYACTVPCILANSCLYHSHTCYLYAGDTSSSSGYEEIEAVPTAQGLRFGDVPSPSGSEFGSPRASMLPDSQAASLSWLGQPGSTQEGMSALAAAPAPSAGAVTQGSILPEETLLQGPEVSIEIGFAAF